jgi:hypothetical protein
LRARAAELLQTAKKDKERRFVEILAKELGAFPPSKLIDSESPDFLVATSKGVLGIEATKIHHANEPRQQESECRSLVDAACRLCENESTIPLEVKVHFGGSTQFNQRNRGKFASILANLVLTNIPRPDSWISLENNWENPSFFPYEIAGLSIIRLSAFCSVCRFLSSGLRSQNRSYHRNQRACDQDLQNGLYRAMVVDCC